MKIGRKYNRLTVVRIIDRNKSECLCDCGKLVTVWNSNLYNGHTKSCGCYNKELSAARMKKDPNTIEINGDLIYIKFDNSDQYCIINKESYDLVKDYRWSIGSTGYAVSRTEDKGKMYLMHRIIMNVPDDMVIDHVNHNKLDNRLSNLRICTQIQNTQNYNKSKKNTSGYKGVSKSGNKWLAQIYHNGKHYHIGLFNTAEEAARARDKKAKELCGEYAYLNFPDDN